MPIDQGVLDSVVNSNMKTVGEAAAFYQAQAFSNHVQSGNRLAMIAEAATGKTIEMIQNIDMSEAASVNKVATGNDVAAQMAALLAAIASGQQQVKTAQSTPPTTP